MSLTLFLYLGNDSSIVKEEKTKQAFSSKKMLVSLDRRLLYGLVVPSTFVIIGGIIWYYKHRKSLNRKKPSSLHIYFQISLIFFLFLKMNKYV